MKLQQLLFNQRVLGHLQLMILQHLNWIFIKYFFIYQNKMSCFRSKKVDMTPVNAGSVSNLKKRQATQALALSNFQPNTYQAPVAPVKPFQGGPVLNNPSNNSNLYGVNMGTSGLGGMNTSGLGGVYANPSSSSAITSRIPKATISYAAQDYDSVPLTNPNTFVATKKVTHFVNDRGDRPQNYADQINHAVESKLLLPNSLLNYDLDQEGGVSKTPIVNTFHYQSVLNHFLMTPGEIYRSSNMNGPNFNGPYTNGPYMNGPNMNPNFVANPAMVNSSNLYSTSVVNPMGTTNYNLNPVAASNLSTGSYVGPAVINPNGIPVTGTPVYNVPVGVNNSNLNAPGMAASNYNAPLIGPAGTTSNIINPNYVDPQLNNSNLNPMNTSGLKVY